MLQSHLWSKHWCQARLEEQQEIVERLERQLEKEQISSLRKQQKLEQDFDFHKQQVVNDCGRHIEELQEEHRENLRNIDLGWNFFTLVFKIFC